jgi:hypothetical protein
MFNDGGRPMEVARADQSTRKPHRFAPGVSGNPKGKAAVRERADELFQTMAPDFGTLSATDEVLLRQACLLLARSERVHRVRDIDVGVRMSGEARRLLAGLQRKRDRSKRDSGASALQEYLASREMSPDVAEHDAAAADAFDDAPAGGGGGPLRKTNRRRRHQAETAAQQPTDGES